MLALVQLTLGLAALSRRAALHAAGGMLAAPLISPQHASAIVDGERVADAEAAGVFGVPSYLLDDGELFWGREHLSLIRLRLHKRGLARRETVSPEVPFVWQKEAWL